MSVCKFIAADISLKEVAPSKEYPLHIDLDNGIIDDVELTIISFCSRFLMFKTIPTKSTVYIWNGTIQMDEQNRY